MQKQKFDLVCAGIVFIALLLCSATLSPAQETQPQSTQATEPSNPQSSPSPSEGNGQSDPASAASQPEVETMFPHLSNTHFWLSGQANFISQGHLSFNAKYTGKNSFRPDFQEATSRIFTLYTGVRFNNSAELLVDIEEASGFGMSNSLGLAGYTNLDVVRIPGEGSPLSTAPYLARAMIHKVFALSKDKVENEREPFSLFEELPRRRLEVRFGKFDVVDFFDQNSVGSDTHFQFMNWTLDANGAYDYAADTRGYTVGLTVEYEDRNWGLRFAETLMPKIANGIDLVYQPWKGVHADNWEYEWRHGFIPKKAGVLRLLAYTNYANMGIYEQAIAQFDQHLVPAPDITDHPYHITRKYGFGVNVEQNLTRYITGFGRFSWNNDKTESFCYTEVGQSFSGGLGANGAMWHRRYDRAGAAFVTNAISKAHQTYLADGGYGFLLGDGALNYGRETIEEAYYTAHVWRGAYLGPDLQHINNPGYNRDRGPVLVVGGRLHLEF